MSVHKTKDGRWFVKFYQNGKAKKLYTGRGKAAKRQAEAIDLEIKARKKAGRKLPWEEEEEQQPIYLDELARMYIRDKLTVCTAKYINDLRSLLNKYVLPKVAHIPCDKLTYNDIMDAARPAIEGKSIATRNRRMAYLRTVFNWGIKHGYITHNPLKAWTSSKEPRKKVQLTVKDLQKIIQHAEPHLAWAIEVEWNLGTRPGPTELLSLKWENVDWDNNCIWVYASKTKTWRSIPITNQFRRRLLEMKTKSKSGYIIEYRGKPIKQFRRSLKTACRKAGITYPVRMYDIRHLFASVMLAGGADLAAVSALLGHQDISTTQRAYYELLRGEKERAVGLLPQLQITEGEGKDAKVVPITQGKREQDL